MNSTYSSSSGGTGSAISVIYPPGEPKSLFPGGVGSTGVGETPKSLTKESTGTLPETLTCPLTDGLIPSEDAISFTLAIPSDVRQDLCSRMLIFIGVLIISPQFFNCLQHLPTSQNPVTAIPEGFKKLHWRNGSPFVRFCYRCRVSLKVPISTSKSDFIAVLMITIALSGQEVWSEMVLCVKSIGALISLSFRIIVWRGDL